MWGPHIHVGWGGGIAPPTHPLGYTHTHTHTHDLPCRAIEGIWRRNRKGQDSVIFILSALCSRTESAVSKRKPRCSLN